MAKLTIGALGVVFGDIGTSPLYAVSQIFYSHSGVEVTRANVLGCMSLVLWALLLVISVKYVLFVLWADNDGEGGVFALYGLIHQQRSHRKIFGVQGVLWLLILAAGLLFGDGMITPAISVLSAVEGLKIATPVFEPYVVPITLMILTALFAVQARGTATIGATFGPIVICWMAAISFFGSRQIWNHPDVLHAFNPWHALEFLLAAPLTVSLLVMGAVMLTITGGEALYADMGHFGRRPIRLSWFAVVLPSLLLNYLGQGAFLLSGQRVVGENIFYSMIPPELLYPMVGLATAATIVASQALISGAYSMMAQAVALGLFPRLRIVHTDLAHAGQIFLPLINWILFLGCVALVLGFQSSTALASVYGLAESGVMVATSISMAGIARLYWRWPRYAAALVFGAFLCIDVVFLCSKSLMFLSGGYVPLSVGVLTFVTMVSWRWGRKATFEAYSRVKTISMRELIDLKERSTVFPERNAVLMVAKPVRSEDESVPVLLQLLYTRHGLLPRNIIFVEVLHRKVPYVHGGRCEVRVLQKSETSGAIFSVSVQFGFMEPPDVEAALEELAAHHEIDLDPSPEKWIVHVSHENLRPARRLSFLDRMRFRIFSFLRQVSTPGYYYYGLGDKVQLSMEILPVRLR